VGHEEKVKKRETRIFEAIRACVAEIEEMWTALPDSCLQVWLTLPDIQFSSTIPLTRHIRKKMPIFQE
jgi:hypothetical protein